jgi:hypothetical protein
VNHYEAADVRILEARRRRILARMSVLASAPAARLSHSRRSPTKPTSAPPPGTYDQDDLTVKRTGPPSKDRSLFDHYAYRFREAGNDYWQTQRLCAQAEHDYACEVCANVLPWNEDGPAKDARILSNYEGQPPWVVATWEDCTPEHVVRLRRLSELDPATGSPDPDLSLVDRQILAAMSGDMNAKAASEAFGVSRDYVRRLIGARA